MMGHDRGSLHDSVHCGPGVPPTQHIRRHFLLWSETDFGGRAVHGIPCVPGPWRNVGVGGSRVDDGWEWEGGPFEELALNKLSTDRAGGPL